MTTAVVEFLYKSVAKCYDVSAKGMTSLVRKRVYEDCDNGEDEVIYAGLNEEGDREDCDNDEDETIYAGLNEDDDREDFNF